MQDKQDTARRRNIVYALADLLRHYDLPAPMSIDMSGSGLTLKLADNDAAGVHRWAEVLDLGEVTSVRVNGARVFDSVEARVTGRDVGFGVDRTEVWSACDVPAIGDDTGISGGAA